MQIGYLVELIVYFVAESQEEFETKMENSLCTLVSDLVEESY